MMRERSGISSAEQPVGIALPVDTLMVVANDLCDFRVIVDVREDALTDLGVLLHLAPLFERERAGLLEQTGGKPNLADVVDEPAQMR